MVVNLSGRKTLIRLVFLVSLLTALGACNGEIYVRDGVTDGDTFSIQPAAATSDSPVTQSWIRYSLSRSVCQLEANVPNPARATSYDCELEARQHLVEAWQEKTGLDGAVHDAYLDDLRFVAANGYLREYVAHYFSERTWTIPDDLSMSGYHTWRRRELRGHRPVTHIVGSWSYRPVTQQAQGGH